MNKRNFIHGQSYTKEYGIWKAMRDRCRNPNNTWYAEYGGRGVKVCERWESFENFLSDMGRRPSKRHSIDRYPDKNGDYEPGNCRWATPLEQNNNLRSNVLLAFRGRTQSLAAWARELGVSHTCLWWRKKHGWSDERILTEPSQRRALHGIEIEVVL
jgi:hypothetical protein